MAKPGPPQLSVRRLLITVGIVTLIWLLLTNQFATILLGLNQSAQGLAHLTTIRIKGLFYDAPLASGDVKQIRAAFDRDVRAHPADPETYLDIEYFCAQHKRYDLAREYLERSLVPCRDAPRDQRALLYSQLADVYLRIDRTKPQELALLAAQRAVDLDPSNPVYLNQYGYLLADNDQQLDEALLRTSQALQILKRAPDSPDFQMLTGEVEDSYGWALYKLGKYDAAVSALNQAIADCNVKDAIGATLADPKAADEPFGELYYHLGAAYRRLRRPDLAKDALQTALRYEPDNKEAKSELEDMKSDAPVPKQKTPANGAPNQPAPAIGSSPAIANSTPGAPAVPTKTAGEAIPKSTQVGPSIWVKKPASVPGKRP